MLLQILYALFTFRACQIQTLIVLKWPVALQSISALPLDLQIGPSNCLINVTSFVSEAIWYVVIELRRDKLILSSYHSQYFFMQIIAYLNLHDIAIYVVSCPSALFDALALILTVCKTAALARQSKRVSFRNSLSYIILCDGR